MNNHKKPLVCIIVVNWNGERIIGDCLKYLTKTTYKNYKIIVIDNNSEDGSHKIISKFKNVEIVKLKENVGSAPGFNRGWNYCLEKYSPKYICDISNDVMTPQKEWLSIMVDALEKNSSAGICSNFETFPRDYKDKEFLIFKDPNLFLNKKNPVEKVKVLNAVSMLMHIDVVKKVGGKDENFFFGPDDKDFGFRVQKAGFELIIANLSRFVHLKSFSYRASNKDFIYDKQSYGQLIYSLRYEPFINNLKMFLMQLSRSIVTKEDSLKSLSLSNLYFHRQFLKRLFIFSNSVLSAIKNYDKIKITGSHLVGTRNNFLPE